MKRIFLTLTGLSAIFLIAAFVLGLLVGDPTARDRATQSRVGLHIDAAMGALVFSALVHAIVLTYFMGTGRWIEETSQAYRLSPDFQNENRSIKYRTIPALAGCVTLLVLTGAFGSMADPASGGRFTGWAGLTPATIHFAVAAITVAASLFVHFWEYQSIHRNGEIIESILGEVRRIRQEKGLPV